MTGIGGDMFCLFYNASTKKVHALNGSGRSSANITLEGMRKDLGMKKGEVGKIPMLSVHSVTTPGAAAGWVDTVEKFGSGMSLEQVLMPAIELGEKGYPVSEISAFFVRTLMYFPQRTELTERTVGSKRANYPRRLPQLP
jgi:gamma-glutamyltranspeptidase / glutathione hydrolase